MCLVTGLCQENIELLLEIPWSCRWYLEYFVSTTYWRGLTFGHVLFGTYGRRVCQLACLSHTLHPWAASYLDVPLIIPCTLSHKLIVFSLCRTVWEVLSGVALYTRPECHPSYKATIIEQILYLPNTITPVKKPGFYTPGWLYKRGECIITKVHIGRCVGHRRTLH